MTPRFDPERHHRRSIRLRGYDYTRAGAYFVTICAQDRACVLGAVVGDEVRLNAGGQTVAAMWDSLPARFPGVDVDAFVVMPNHLHGIVVLGDTEAAVGAPTRGAHPPGRATTRVAPTKDPITLGALVGAFKSLTTVEYGRGVRSSGWSPFPGRLWQRNYYEHVIRDERSLDHIRQYIADNPARWMEDPENPVGSSDAVVSPASRPTAIAAAATDATVDPTVDAAVDATVGAPLVGAQSPERAAPRAATPSRVGETAGAPRLGAQPREGATTRVAPTARRLR